MSGSWKNQRLQDHFVVLCSELDVNRIVPVLRAERMLTSDEHEQLTNTHYTTRIRREKLLLFIPRKGAAHFEKFAECLVWSGQTELARKIGIPVDEIAPSPYPTEQVPQMTDPEVLMNALKDIIVQVQSGQQTSLPYQAPPILPQPRRITPPPPDYPRQVTDPHPLPPSVGPDNEPSGPKSVFILYCNDPKIRDFSDAVLDMADFLSKACGPKFTFHFDIYKASDPPGSWFHWTEEFITKSDKVLFVCSPSLIEALKKQETSVPMKEGRFNAQAVYHTIKAPKFLPVFVNSDPGRRHMPDLRAPPYESWIPNTLKGTARYWLDFEALHRTLGDVERMTDTEYHHRVSYVLSTCKDRNPELEPIGNLLRHLLHTPGSLQPTPFQTAVNLPRPVHYTTTPVPATTTVDIPAAELRQPAARPEPFTDSELMMIAERIPRDWQNLGIKLGIMYTTLEDIRMRNLFDCRQAAMEMFTVWRRNKGDLATRAALKDALMSVGYCRVVEDVFGKD